MPTRPSRRVQTLLGIFLASIAFIAISPAPASAHGNDNPTKCEQVTHRVTLAPNSTTTYRVSGELCTPKNARTVQVLNAGFTYASYYWNLPYQNERYSYVRAAANDGFATLNIDRLGTGESDKPPADLVTAQAHGWVNAQLASQLRKGNLGRQHTHFKHVIGVGHSLGGIIMTVSQAEHRPFDAVVINGIMHAADQNFRVVLSGIRHDVTLDPKFKNAGLPDGYVTTKPDTRSNYYATQFADPNVIKTDERLKQTATRGEVASLGLASDPSYSQKVKVPTLLWLGTSDGLACNEAVVGLSCASVAAIKAREGSAWQNSTCMGVFLQTESGHDTTLHRSAPNGAAAVSKWLTEMGFGSKKASHHSQRTSTYARCA